MINSKKWHLEVNQTHTAAQALTALRGRDRVHTPDLYISAIFYSIEPLPACLNVFSLSEYTAVHVWYMRAFPEWSEAKQAQVQLMTTLIFDSQYKLLLIPIPVIYVTMAELLSFT